MESASGQEASPIPSASHANTTKASIGNDMHCPAGVDFHRIMSAPLLDFGGASQGATECQRQTPSDAGRHAWHWLVALRLGAWSRLGVENVSVAMRKSPHVAKSKSSLVAS
jgi:hypothetical protein